jgi:uncharacterized protein YbjT (DUF2867 family)
MKIVVIGGTGLIGSKVVSKLTQRGHEALAAAPNTGVNTITGEGLAEALEGAEVVVDLANSPSFEDQAAMDFFQTAGKNLIEAEKAAGVQQHVALSVPSIFRTAAIFVSSWHRRRSSRTRRSPIRCSVRRSSWSSFVASPNWRPKVIQ